MCCQQKGNRMGYRVFQVSMSHPLPNIQHAPPFLSTRVCVHADKSFTWESPNHGKCLFFTWCVGSGMKVRNSEIDWNWAGQFCKLLSIFLDFIVCCHWLYTPQNQGFSFVGGLHLALGELEPDSVDPLARASSEGTCCPSDLGLKPKQGLQGLFQDLSCALQGKRAKSKRRYC